MRLLDRLNVNTMDGFDVRGQVLGIVAHHLKPGACTSRRPVSATARSAGSRRRWTWSCSPASREADCLGRAGGFDCSAMDWFLERARGLGVEHEAPAPLVMGRHLLALGVTPGPGSARS